MIVYNVTISVEEGIEEAWLKWMKEEHMPEVMATGYFEDHKIFRLMSHLKQNEGVTYVCQYFAKSKAILNQYITKSSPALQQKSKAKFGEKALAYRSIMEQVD
ncbi:DUF4286 family protein [Persicobacter psychrovividus]|uniref:DUF4286 family protein n=1 Tax=Persicobacter psychrovividus TaxID=387638 RepID=A0ABN6LA66_9BACT|nr:hypothetical protein PEPS_23880 [Persicobacter psychrovividus]